MSSLYGRNLSYYRVQGQTCGTNLHNVLICSPTLYYICTCMYISSNYTYYIVIFPQLYISIWRTRDICSNLLYIDESRRHLRKLWQPTIGKNLKFEQLWRVSSENGEFSILVSCKNICVSKLNMVNVMVICCLVPKLAVCIYMYIYYIFAT